jgi:hypothetical protein
MPSARALKITNRSLSKLDYVAKQGNSRSGREWSTSFFKSPIAGKYLKIWSIEFIANTMREPACDFGAELASQQSSFLYWRLWADAVGQTANTNPISEHSLYLTLYVSNAGGVE